MLRKAMMGGGMEERSEGGQQLQSAQQNQSQAGNYSCAGSARELSVGGRAVGKRGNSTLLESLTCNGHFYKRKNTQDYCCQCHSAPRSQQAQTLSGEAQGLVLVSIFFF